MEQSELVSTTQGTTTELQAMVDVIRTAVQDHPYTYHTTEDSPSVVAAILWAALNGGESQGDVITTLNNINVQLININSKLVTLNTSVLSLGVL